MTISGASEFETPPEVKEEKTSEIGEAKPETRAATETAKLVDNAHSEPEALVEIAGSIEQAESIETAVVMTVEASVAIVDKAVEAAAAIQEQGDEEDATDSVPVSEKPESAEDSGQPAIDTVPMPETQAEEVSLSQAEDDKDAAIDTAQIAAQPDKMEEARTNTGEGSKSEIAAQVEAAEDALAEASNDAVDQAMATVANLTSTENGDTTDLEYGGDGAIHPATTVEEPVQMEKAEAKTDAYDDPSATERVDSAVNIGSNDSPSGMSASEFGGTGEESFASTTLEEPADNTLRGAESQRNTGEFDDKGIDVGIGREAFVNPNEYIAAVENARDLPGMDPGGIAERGLDLGSITGGPSDMTPGDIKNDVLPEQSFGKSEDDLLNAAGSVGDPRISADADDAAADAGTDPGTDAPTDPGTDATTDPGTTAGTDPATDAATDTDADASGVTDVVSAVADAWVKFVDVGGSEKVSDAAVGKVWGMIVDAIGSSGEPASENVGVGVRGTPDPEGGSTIGPVGSNAEFEIKATNPFEPDGGRGGIMRPEDEGTVFDEERTIPVSLEQALKTKLDPWINWGDDSQGITGPINEEAPKFVKPKGVLGDPDEEMGVGDPDDDVGGGTIPV